MQVDQYTWRIPQAYKQGMRVPGVIYATDELMNGMHLDRTLEQCANVACLPGIYKSAITLPNGHESYGFPVGGVAATDYEEGVISPGGVGYDINCGVRLLSTNLTDRDIQPKRRELVDTIFTNVPSGLGSHHKKFYLTRHQLDKLIVEGVRWVIDEGFGWPEDAFHCEEDGCMKTADPDQLSKSAKQRGLDQLGTLGSGSHFLEIGKVDCIYDLKIAKTFGLIDIGQITVMIHCGSRGLGHQTCSDYLQVMDQANQTYQIPFPNRELACAPGMSSEAQHYYQAMACAANFAFANRQMINYKVRTSFEHVFNRSADRLGLKLVYDVAHNIAKVEDHVIDGKRRPMWLHRKGATRCLGPGSEAIPADYQAVGQPVLIPGSMGSSSWVMSGTDKAMELSFGSTAHGAGRVLSCFAAKQQHRGNDVQLLLRKRGIITRFTNETVLSEEAPGAYKDVDRVVEVIAKLCIATKVARLIPIAVVKG